jgi:hypothetical protein
MFYVPGSRIILNSISASITTLQNWSNGHINDTKTVLENCLKHRHFPFSVLRGQTPHAPSKGLILPIQPGFRSQAFVKQARARSMEKLRRNDKSRHSHGDPKKTAKAESHGIQSSQAVLFYL